MKPTHSVRYDAPAAKVHAMLLDRKVTDAAHAAGGALLKGER